MKNFLFLFILFLFFHTHITAQNHSVIGHVVDNNNQPVEYFNVIVLNADSLFLKGGTFISGIFKIENINVSRCIVKISFVGSNTESQSVVFENDTIFDIGYIKMKPSILKEVTIIARRPELKLENGSFIFNVENTSISNIGTGIDVLQQTPMLLVDQNNNLNVGGRGTPIVYINGRRIISIQEVKNLKSSEIKKVEVITNPSAKYDAEGNSVVNIFLKSNSGNEGFSATIQSELNISRKLGNVEFVQLGYKHNRINIFGSYTFRIYGTKTYQEDSRIMSISTFENKTFYKTETEIKQLEHVYRFGFDYHINKKNILGLQLYGWYSKNNDSLTISNQYFIDYQNGLILNKTNRLIQNPFSTLNLNYLFNIDTTGQFLRVLVDYSDHYSNTSNTISEANLETIFHRSQSNSNSYIYSVLADYSLPLSKQKMLLELGFKASQVNQNNDNKFESLIEGNNWEIQNNLTNNFKYFQTTYASYITLQKTISKVIIKTGIRYENQYTKATSGNSTLFDRRFDDFFPNASIETSLSDNIQITCNYAKRTSRPSYQSLNPTVLYFDRYAYLQGNPELLPSTIHDLTLTTILFKKVYLTSGYQNIYNPINPAFYVDENNTEITIIKTINYGNMKYYRLGIMYDYSNKKDWLSIRNSINFTAPKMEIIDHGMKRMINKPQVFYGCNTTFRFKKLPEFSFYFNYLSSSELAMGINEPMYSLSFMLRQKFFKEKLSANLYVNDIFCSWVWRDTMSIGNMYRENMYDSDSRFLRISFTWDLGTFKPYLKTQSGNQEERDRL